MSATLLFRRILNLTLAPLPVRSGFYQPFFVLLTLLLGLIIALLPLNMAILLVGGGLLLTLLLINPAFGIYLLIPTIPFSSLLTVQLAGAKVGLMEVLLLLTLAAALAQILSHRSLNGWPYIIKTGPLLWPFVMLIAVFCLTWLNTVSIGATLIETAKWIEMLLLYLLVINFIPAKQIKWVIGVIILSGVAQALLGLYQFVFKVGPDGFLLFGGRFLRAYGTFAQPNPYAGYLGLILPLALSVTIWAFEQNPLHLVKQNPLHFSGRQSSEINKPFLQNMLGFTAWLLKLSIYVIPLAIMGAALFASQSRGAWLGFAVAALATVLVRSKKALVALAIGLMLAASIALIGSFELNLSSSSTQNQDVSEHDTAYTIVLQRFSEAISIVTIDDVATTPVTHANFATLERLAHWQAAREMWRDNLWLGVGFGNYAVIYPAYAVGRWVDPLGHAHNYILNIGAEIGLIGITAYLIFWIFIFGVSWSIVQYSHGFDKAVVAGAVGVMVHLHSHNLVDNLYVQGLYLHLVVILGIVSIIHLQLWPAQNP